MPSGDVTEVMKKVAEVAAEPFHSGKLENFHIVEHPAGHMVLKKLIANDEQRTKDGKEGMCQALYLALYLFKKYKQIHDFLPFHFNLPEKM